MAAINVRQTIRDLNLAENLLGSHEDPKCFITKLRLTWNMIRFSSGVALTKSLAFNTSLTFLDV
eukprot:gene29932-39734_t